MHLEGVEHGIWMVSGLFCAIRLLPCVRYVFRDSREESELHRDLRNVDICEPCSTDSRMDFTRPSILEIWEYRVWRKGFRRLRGLILL